MTAFIMPALGLLIFGLVSFMLFVVITRGIVADHADHADRAKRRE